MPWRISRHGRSNASRYPPFAPLAARFNPFAELSLERAMALRWILRDIKARRMKLSPVSESDLRTLIGLGLVEMRDDAPVLTNNGHAALD
jgi:hypothetical protein